MENNIIKITSNDKITSLRVREKTKKMLDSLALGKETHEEIILRLIKMNNRQSNEGGTAIVDAGDVISTKYERLSKTITIEFHNQKYEVVCTYNDLTVIAMLRQNKQMRNYMVHKGSLPHWELDLEIVNIRINNGEWRSPQESLGDQNTNSLIYLSCIKQILEETFDISLYEITNEDDFHNIEKWNNAYKRYSLSMESFYSDIEKRLTNE